jgi:hypothetical protein
LKDLEEQLVQKYENLLLKAQKYKMPEREFTIFDTALKSHHENPITELLAFFLDPNEKHTLGSSFYEGFINVIKAYDEFSQFDFGQLLKLQTQQVTTKGKVIDLWFETDTALVIVEVKVYHHQNNPFKDYEMWGNKKLKELNAKVKGDVSLQKKLITVIFCPNGECYTDGWLGLAYQDLTSEVRMQLGANLLHNPFSKWGIFARDFLLHLDGFIDLLETNMESLKFVVDNMQKIQEILMLREDVYQEIINHINNEIQKALGEDYEPRVRRHTWSDGPAFRFVGNNWKDWSDTVLNLHVDRSPMSCSITMYIQHPTDEIIKQVKKYLSSRRTYSQTEPWKEQSGKFWCMRWELAQFDLNEVTKQIVFLQKLLNLVELEWK